MDQELAALVHSDLEYLFAEWNQQIDDAALRRNSTVLRTLLVEGKLAQVARAYGRDLRISTPAVFRDINPPELEGASFFQAGGARFRGGVVQSITIYRGQVPNESQRSAIAARAMRSMEGNYLVKLGTYLQQTSFVIDGVRITREEVIKYVANKLGGAHYDPSRGGQALDQKYALMDKARAGTIVMDKNVIYYELLSIGQSVVNSRDVRVLRRHLATVLALPPVIFLPHG